MSDEIAMYNEDFDDDVMKRSRKNV